MARFLRTLGGLWLAAAASAADTGPPLLPTLGRVTGKVYVHFAFQPETEYIEAVEGAPLEEGDEIRTDASGASAEIILGRGAVLELGPASALTLHSLGNNDKELHLHTGSAVGVLSGLPRSVRFEVHTPLAVETTSGAEFGIVLSPERAVIGVFDQGRAETFTRGSEDRRTLSGRKEIVVKESGDTSPAGPLAALLPLQVSLERARSWTRYRAAAWRPLPEYSRDELRRRLLDEVPKAAPNRRGVVTVIGGAVRGGRYPSHGERAEAAPAERLVFNLPPVRPRVVRPDPTPRPTRRGRR
ncbi:MAG: FecR domain-containing protein [Elusimicrobia bacterium]|nr:FecR domain-containing protein [Elusimicrobiota bacterium]